jgi:hypothetical protein
MAIEREHVHEVHEHEPVLTEQSAAVRDPYGIAQFLSLGIGILLIVIGAIGLARAGIHHIDSPTVTVGPFAMTPLLALVELFLGLLGLIGAAGRAAARTVCMFIGPVMLAGGIVATIQGVRVLGWNTADGVIYILLGAVAIVGAIMTPPMTTYAERRITTA